MQASAGHLSRRKVPDRRRHATPFISRYTFWGGRRKYTRRGIDRKSHLFVDVYSARIWILLLSLISLSTVDAHFTLLLTHERLAVELNPVMAYYLGKGSSKFLLGKLFLTIVSIIVFCICKNIILARIGVVIAVLAYLGVVIYELNILYSCHVLFQ